MKTQITDNLWAEYLICADGQHAIAVTWENSPERMVGVLLTGEALIKLGEFAMKEAKAHDN